MQSNRLSGSSRPKRNGLEALEAALTNGLAGPFCNAVNIIGGISGRVIVTGVGKSGPYRHEDRCDLRLDRKRPLFFVHPVEANHGDLGMIGRDDAILAMSWGGESQELLGILNYSRRFSIPLIAMTAGGTSTLAREADVVLLLPKVQEACPHGLAPTTSTVLQLAMGDAIRDFPAGSPWFHAERLSASSIPAASWGRALPMCATSCTRVTGLPLVKLGTPMPEAIVYPVAQAFRLRLPFWMMTASSAGIVTEGDMARNLTRNLAETLRR